MVSRAVGRAVGLCPACVRSRARAGLQGSWAQNARLEAPRRRSWPEVSPREVTLRVMAALAEKQEASGCEGETALSGGQGVGTAPLTDMVRLVSPSSASWSVRRVEHSGSLGKTSGAASGDLLSASQYLLIDWFK